MIELGKEKRQLIEPLCQGENKVLVRSAAEGAMGRVWVPDLVNPSYCLIRLGDFVYLFGVCPKGEQALELRALLYRECSGAFITPSDERWAGWLEEMFAGEYRMMSRYAMRRDKNHFDVADLEGYAGSLPESIRMKRMDKKLYYQAMKEQWSRDFCANFESPEEFLRDGLGFVAMDGRKIVSGCSAYGISQGMMEIQVETKKEYQRQGLALACSARFILTCLEMGIYPSWDAVSLQSVGLAEKLGYVFDREYKVFLIFDEESRLLMA